MILHITDDNYRKRVERFINQNFDQYGNVKVSAHWNDTWGSTQKIITDDPSRITDDTHELYLLTTDSPTKQHEIYKYKKFNQILEEVGYKQSDSYNSVVKIICVTSILGGTGKTTIAKALTQIYEKYGKTLYLPLFSPNREGVTLNDVLFDVSFGQTPTDLPTLGFNHLEDLQNKSLSDNIMVLRDILKHRGVRTLILDTPPQYIFGTIESVDITLLIRDYRRLKEESEWIQLMDCGSHHTLFNFVDNPKQHNEIAAIDFKHENELTSYVQNYLKQEGYIEH